MEGSIYLTAITEGNVEKLALAKEVISSENLKPELSLKILVKLSHNLAKNSIYASVTEENHIEAIFQFCMCLCQQIVNLNHVDQKTYFTALHHAINYLIGKDRIDLAVALEENFLHGHNVKCEINDSCSDILYATYCKVNLKISKDSVELSKLEHKHVLKYLEKNVQVLACINKYSDSKFTILNSCFKIAKVISSEFVEEVVQFQINCIDIILSSFEKPVDMENERKVFTSFITLMVDIINYYLKENKLNYIQLFKLRIERFLDILNQNLLPAKCLKLFSDVISILIALENYNYKDFSKVYQNAHKLVEKNSRDSCLQIFVFSVSRVLLTCYSTWRKLNSETWITMFPPKTQLVLYKLIVVISDELKYFAHSLPAECKEDKDVPSDLCYSIYTLVIVLQMYRISINYNMVDLNNTFELVKESSSKCFVLLKEMKEVNCKKWEITWKTTGTEVFNLACILYNKRMYSQCVDIFGKFLLEHVMVMVGSITESNLVIDNSLFNAVKLTITSLVELREYQKALVNCLVWSSVLPQYAEKIFLFWVKVKKKALEDNCIYSVTSTVCTICEVEADIVKTSFPFFDISSTNMAALLKQEVTAYVTLMWCRPDVLNNILDASCKCCDVYVTSELLVATSEAFSVSCDQSLNSQIIKYCGSLISKLFEKLQANDAMTEHFKILLYLGDMHYLKFIWESKDVQQKNRDCLDKTAQNLYISNMEELGETQENIINFNENLIKITISDECELLSSLNHAIKFWFEAVNCKYEFVNKAELINLIGRIETCAYAFLLYGYYGHSLHAWALCYKLSKRIACSKTILKAITEMITVCDVGGNHSLLSEAKSLVQEIQGNSPDCSELILFLMLECHICLRNKQFESGLKLLKDLLSMYDKFNNWLVKSKFCLLLSQYLALCNSVQNSKEFQQFDCTILIADAFNFIKISIEDPKLNKTFKHQVINVITLLEIVYWSIDLSFLLGWHKDCYDHVQEALIVCQLKVLPSRLSNLMIVMAQLDLLINNRKECFKKLLSSGYVLEFFEKDVNSENLDKSSENSFEETTSIVQSGKTDIEMESDEDFKLKRVRFDCPLKFLHSESCTCMKCKNLLVRHLFVLSVFLWCQLFEKTKQKDEFLYYIELFENNRFELKYKTENVIKELNNNISQLIGEDVQFFGLLNKFLGAQNLFIWLDVESLCIKEQYNKALELNVDALKSSVENIALEQMLLEQNALLKAGIFLETQFDQRSEETTSKDARIKKLKTIFGMLSFEKTPEQCTKIVSYESTASFAKTPGNTYFTPYPNKMMQRKKLEFSDDDSDESINPKSSTEENIYETKKLPINKCSQKLKAPKDESQFSIFCDEPKSCSYSQSRNCTQSNDACESKQVKSRQKKIKATRLNSEQPLIKSKVIKRKAEGSKLNAIPVVEQISGRESNSVEGNNFSISQSSETTCQCNRSQEIDYKEKNKSSVQKLTKSTSKTKSSSASSISNVCASSSRGNGDSTELTNSLTSIEKEVQKLSITAAKNSKKSQKGKL